MNRRYIASLAVGAVLTLALGLFVRNRINRAEPAAASAAPSEAAAMQQLSQEGQLRRLASSLSERISAVAALVEYVPAARATGVRWRGRDSVVTTLADRPAVMLHIDGGDTTRMPSVAASDSMRGEWALVVARGRDGNVISAANVVGGRVAAPCAGRTVTEFVVGIPLPDAFAGAGVFDLDGRLTGIVVRCGDHLAAVPIGALAPLLTDSDPLGRRMRDHYGFAARPLDEVARAYFATDSGLFVTEVHRDSPADRAGWMPGDVIRAVDGVAVGASATIERLDSLADTHTVVVRRNGATRVTRLLALTMDSGTARDGAATGIELARPLTTRGITIGAVRGGSAAEAAGMHAGDRLLRVDDVAVNSRATAQRLLGRARAADRATLIVFERDSVRHGVLLRR